MENGQPSDVRQLRYAPAPGAGFGVEVLSFERLRQLDRGGRRTGPQRPDFHVLALVRSGVGHHAADFVDHPLRAGGVVWIRPGVVHRWTDVDRVDGPLVLFEPGFLPAWGPAQPAAADAFAPACWQLDDEAWALSLLAADHLGREHAAAVADPRLASPPLLAHLLSALVLRVLPAGGEHLGGEHLGGEHLGGGHAGAERTGNPGHAEQHEIFRRYQVAVEHRFAEDHQVTGYARILGYDRRTLTRATRAATGLGAKQFLDQRILLEAKRLLAHTDLPVARCAERVGFADAANFTTFFQRQAGLSPSRWRAGHSGR
ncbi:AraC family transcriptional regulator [Kitasatospora sp. NBC_01266]